MVTIYHNPRCRKSREALQILTASNLDLNIREYLKEPPSEAELSELLEKLDMQPLELIRKGEKVFKERFKGKDLSSPQWIRIMTEYPILIERPIVIRGQKGVVARPPEKLKALLK